MVKWVLVVLGMPGALVYVGALAEEGTLPGFSTLLLPLAIISLLVLLNGLYVAGEFSLIGVRPSRIEQLAEEGVKPAGQVQEILDSNQKQDSYIATAQLGITIASLGLGMYGEPAVAHFIEPYLERLVGIEPTPAILHTIATILALGTLTYLHVVIGEMVPKSLALAAAERTVLLIFRPMRISQTILSWPVRFLNNIGRLLLRFLRIPPAEGQARLHSQEELELIVAESAEGGLLYEEEGEMILNIFDFSDRQVGQVMTPRRKIQALPHEMPLPTILSTLAESNHSRFPVYKDDLDHVIGILHLKDVLHFRLRGDGPFDIDLLLRPAPAVPETLPVEQLLAAFKRERLHMAIVLDEFGGMAGIVTLEDLVEEVVGEVRDEFDTELEPLIEVGPGELDVAGDYLVDDLRDYVYLGDEKDLPDVETVGGLIITGLGRPPQVGDEIEMEEGICFEVVEVDGRAVTRVRVTYPDPYDPDTGSSTEDS
jgi:CBS domain containing-hemolysin-like protein